MKNAVISHPNAADIAWNFFLWLSNSTGLSEVGAIVEENVRILPKGRFIGELEESLASPHSSSHKSNNCGKYVEVDSS